MTARLADWHSTGYGRDCRAGPCRIDFMKQYFSLRSVGTELSRAGSHEIQYTKE